MSPSSTGAGLLYPLSGFRFSVHFQDIHLLSEMRFQEVGGLKIDMETESVPEGGAASFGYLLPTRVRYAPLELKRGVAPGMNLGPLSAWIRKALEEFVFEPKLVTISLLGENLFPLMVWEAHQCWPMGWSLGTLDAGASGVAVETLTLAYSHLRLLL